METVTTVSNDAILKWYSEDVAALCRTATFLHLDKIISEALVIRRLSKSVKS
jgi:hypothetical protein